VTGDLKDKIIFGLFLGLAVILALGLVADLPRLLESLRQWRWAYLPLVLLAVLSNYGLRFWRWHYYLAITGIKGVAWPDSLTIFLSGFTLTMTPGKLGEVLKSVLLKQLNDTPVSYSAPLVMAERLTDVLAMVLLAVLGLGTFQVGAQGVAVALVACLSLVIIVQQRRLSLRLLDMIGRLPCLGRFAGLARNLYESSFLLLRWRPLLAASLLSTVAWFGECLAFYLVILGLGVPPHPALLLQATFIYASASLLGAMSFLPGGLGATEGSMAILLMQVSKLGKDPAIAATLLVRFATLWFAVLLGLVALMLFQLRHGGTSSAK